MHEEVFAVLNRDGLISSSVHPHLTHRIRHYAKQGLLARIIDDHYCLEAAAATFEVRVAAARRAYPNGVFVRETAARLSWWPELRPTSIQLAAERRHPVKGFVFERREVPTDLRAWTGEHFLSSPALTVLDLTDTIGGTAIDEALRRRVVSLEDLHDALAQTVGRRGNQRRAQLLHESRDHPWSPLEREAHVMLRRAHFDGWVANHPVEVEGRQYFVDLAVPELRLGAEIDGWEFHRSLQSFIADREKWNALTLAGWTLLHFTAHSLHTLVEQMKQAQRQLQMP